MERKEYSPIFLEQIINSHNAIREARLERESYKISSLKDKVVLIALVAAISATGYFCLKPKIEELKHDFYSTFGIEYNRPNNY
ncbi:MAG: hypothetical protein ACOYT4_04425 [Nanoarchaeota archaeon]